MEPVEVLDGQVQKETQGSQDLLDQWGKGDRPARRDREVPQGSQVCLESLARMVYLVMLERGGHPESQASKVCPAPREWPDLRALPVSLARPVSRVYPAPPEFRGNRDDPENRAKRVHPGRQDHKVGLACRDHQDCRDSLAREDCLVCRACLD